jgi:hypothetical protein
MTERESEQIDQLVSEIADEGVSADRIERLERLLLGQPELQVHYAKAVRLHTLMQHELGHGLQTTQPLTHTLAGSKTETLPAAVCVSLANSLRQDSTTTTPLKSIVGALAGLAVAVTIVAATVVAGSRLLQGTATEVARQPAEFVPANQRVSNTEALPVWDIRSLELVSRVTRTSAITQLLLPIETDKNATIGAAGRLCAGNAWIERSPSDLERGFVVALYPGCRMDLHVDTDASGQNALGVVELDSRGKMTGGTLSFNNLVGGSVDNAERRIGCIGEYTVENDDLETKYFLFAGSYLDTGGDGLGEWKQSDYAVLQESTEFLVLGWDDSSYPGAAPIDEIGRDRDYNDVCAVIRFSGPAHHVSAPEKGVLYLPEAKAASTLVKATTSGYIVDVRPQEKLLMAVSSSAHLQNSVRIVEAASRRVIWQQDGTQPGSGDAHFQAGRRGIYIICNNTDTVRRYEIQARHIAWSNGQYDGSWVDSPFKVTDEGDHWASIGFEDSIEDSTMVDWNDIRVHARWFDDGPIR